MSKPSSGPDSIQETMSDQIRKTMNVVQTIKGHTETLLHKTETIIDLLADDIPAPKPAEEVEIVEIDIAPPPADDDGPVDAILIDAVARPDPHLVAEITKACVKEVMATINPVLDALTKFIKANSAEPQSTQEVDDDAFAAKLIEEMKISLGRRQRIALARKRMTPP